MKALHQSFPKAPMRRILQVVGLSVGAWYDKRAGKVSRERPGPKPKQSDQDVLEAIKVYLQAPDFYKEGYKKLRVRLAHRGIVVGKERLRRILGENGLLCGQVNRVLPLGLGDHDGTITTTTPNELWGMDMKEFRTSCGKLYFFDIIDHYNSEVKGWHLSITCNRSDAMQGIRNAVREEFGQVGQKVCSPSGLSLRVDHGSQFDSTDFERELEFLGIRKSSAFVRSPQCNGVIERFHRTIKEQLIDIHSAKDLTQVKEKIEVFVRKYNQKWLLHRLGLQSPLDYKKNNIPSGKSDPKEVCHQVEDLTT